MWWRSAVVRVSYVTLSKLDNGTYRFGQIVCNTSASYNYSNTSNGVDNGLVLRSPGRYSVPHW